MNLMSLWHDFLDSIDSDGGHILVLMILMLVGVIAYRNGFPKAEDVVMGTFGALLLALKDAGSNKDRNETTIEKTSTVVTIPKEETK